MDLIKVAWAGAEVGAIVLGVREVFNVTPIVDLAGASAFTAFAALALVAGGVSLLDKYEDYAA